MTYWSETYLGDPAQGERPCWFLLRKIWKELAGLEMPSFEGDGNGLLALARETGKFKEVPIGQEKPLDAVLMNTDVKIKGKWVEVEGHIGICAKPGLVLHVERGGTALIDLMKDLRVTRILAGPWHDAR